MRVSENTGLAKEQQRGGASPPLLPPQFCALSLVGPDWATLATAIWGSQTGSGTRLKHQHAAVQQLKLLGCIHPRQQLPRQCPGTPRGQHAPSRQQSGGWKELSYMGTTQAMAPALGLFDLRVPAKDASASWGWECNLQGTISERGSVTAP